MSRTLTLIEACGGEIVWIHQDGHECRLLLCGSGYIGQVHDEGEWVTQWEPVPNDIRLHDALLAAHEKVLMDRVGSENAQLREALQHMHSCLICGEGDWNECEEGQKALSLLEVNP